MKPYDATKNIRRMFHKPNILPLSNLLIIILVMFYVVPIGGAGKGCYADTPKAENANYEPLHELPVISICKNGNIMMAGCTVEDLSKLPCLILDEMEETQPAENKILIKIDRDVPFGKVQEVLRYVKEAEVETVGLVTREYAAPVHFFNPPKH